MFFFLDFCHGKISSGCHAIGIPMGTSSSIRHQFDVKIPRGKFVELTSILKGKSMWKLWHQFNVDSTFKVDEISMSFPHEFFYVVSTSNRRNVCTRCFYSIISKQFLLWEPILSYSKLLNNIDVITDIGTFGTISFGNFCNNANK